MFLNADLIETVEAVPETMVTLVDGRRFLLHEAPQEVAAAVVSFRATVILAADDLRGASRPTLHALPGPGRTDGRT